MIQVFVDIGWSGWWWARRVCGARGTRALGAGVVVLGLVGCPDPHQKKPEAVAEIGDTVVTDRAFLALLAQRGVARVPDAAGRAAVIDDVLTQVVDEELLLRAAQAAGVVVADEAVEREIRNRSEGYAAGSFQETLTAEELTVDAYRSRVRRRLTQDAFLRQKFGALTPVSEAEVEARYQQAYAEKKTPPQVRVRQVLLRTAEEARHVLGELQTRKLNMESAAQKYSVGLEKDAGGDLGWFSQGEMPKVFDICFVLEPGQISDVIASEFGFHILQVVDRRPERVEPLAAVRDEIEAALVAERQSAELARVLAELRAATPVTLHKDVVATLAERLPAAPVTEKVRPDDTHAKALDSHDDGVDPIPPLPRDR